jgi:hypothetical protein
MIVGHEPIKFATLCEPPLKKLFAELQAQGLEPTLPLLANKDSELEMGYRIIYYPGTRREVWAGYHQGHYEHILMLRPPKVR